ncbi:hypothetical protein BSKO_10102 [Bryopsis sp. KO-2023]|nr:hypothetical protein BSKO_10102 [Bryopsis sp. KO-2023]
MDVVKVQPLVVPSETILPLSELTGENTQYPIDPPLRLPTIPHLYGARTLYNPSSPLNFKKALEQEPGDSSSSKCMDGTGEDVVLLEERYSEIWSFGDDEFQQAFGTDSEKLQSPSSRDEGETSVSDTGTSQHQHGEREHHREEVQHSTASVSSSQMEPSKKYDFDFFPVPYDLVGQFFHIPEPNLPPSVTGFPPPAAFSDCRNQFPRKYLPGDQTLLPPGQLLPGNYYPMVENAVYYAPPPPPDRAQRRGGSTSNRTPPAYGCAYMQQNTVWETGQQCGVSANNPQGVKRGNRNNNRSGFHCGQGLKRHEKVGGKFEKGQNGRQRLNQQLQDPSPHTVLANNSQAPQCSSTKDPKKSWYGPFIFPPPPPPTPPYPPYTPPHGGIRPPPHMLMHFNPRPRFHQQQPRLGTSHGHPSQRLSSSLHAGFGAGANNFGGGSGYCVLQNGVRGREGGGWGIGMGVGTRQQGRHQQGRWYGGRKTTWGKKY